MEVGNESRYVVVMIHTPDLVRSCEINYVSMRCGVSVRDLTNFLAQILLTALLTQ